ncbi:transporter [Leifsonia sp. 22587]|uniref:transporter n=1 Tax=Leifsonia sp. 22587 TaxID=3453946 RepID=UPI003F84CF13
MTPSLREPRELGATVPAVPNVTAPAGAPAVAEPSGPAADTAPVTAPASRNAGGRVLSREMTARSIARRLGPPLGALVAGCVAACLLLNAALGMEFPLFSEASAERGRDCTAIASARHALDATLQARLPLRAPDAEAAQAIRSAVAAFRARTEDLATDSVVTALGPVRGSLSALSDSVSAYAAAPSASMADDTMVEQASDAVHQAWQGSIARVCA